MSSKQSKVQNILTVLIGALLMGFLWRIRGTNGWGSSWGLLNAGAMFMLFAVTVIGPRKKLNLGWIGVSSLMFMLTVPTWGTFLDQITGIISSEVVDELGNVISGSRFIPVASGVGIMLILGFGLATLWGIMLGRALSDKQWKIKDFVLILAVFFVSMYVSRATLAHTLAELIQPQALELFKEGLFTQGIVTEDSFESIYKTYMEHFDDMSWAKKIMGGRNYFALVETISIAIGGIFSMIATRFIIKDKIAANMGLITSAAFAFSITLSDLFFYFGDGGYHGTQGLTVPSNLAPWSCWEYFTGFFAGAIITIAILCYKNQKADVAEIAFSGVPQKIADVLTFIVGFVVVFGINIVRPVLDRFEDSDYLIPAVAIAFVGAVVVIILAVRKYGVNLEKTSYETFCAKALVFMLIYMICIYLFTGIAEGGNNIIYIDSVHNITMVLSFAVLAPYFTLKALKKES